MAMAVTQPETFTFDIEHHTRNSFRILEHMQKDRLLCDVTLVAKDMEIPAHKNVLASCSPYFYSMFTNPQTAEQRRIELDVNPQIMLSIVNYMYTSKITVIEQDVMDLFEVSKMLLLTGIQVECGNIMKRILSPNNCFNIQRVAANCGDSKLLNSASSYIDDNFIDAIASTDFLNLSSDEMAELISKDTLKVCSEEKVYECIVRWINHDPKGRRKYLRLLMGYVRLRFIPKDYLNQHIIEGPFLKGNCNDLLLKAVVEEYITTVPKPKPRLYDRKVLLIIGGYDGSDGKSLEYYDFSKKCWSNTLEIPFNVYHGNLVAVNQKVYLVGGRRNGRPTCTVNDYDINTNSWEDIDNMTTIRESHGIAVLNNCIYAVGGFDGFSILNSAEKFDIQVQQWSLIAPMLENRSYLGAAILNDILYVVGGWNKDGNLNSVECYHQRTDTWNELNSMNICRQALGVCALDGKLYAIGGYDGKYYLSSVEIYSPDTNMWTIIKPMHTARAHHSMAVIDNKIYITGGHNCDGRLNSTEVYDKITDMWIILPEVMNMAKRSHASVIANKCA